MINSQNLEVTVMRVVSLSSFVCFTWFGWQNLSLFKIMPLGLSAWFILSQNGFLPSAGITYFSLKQYWSREMWLLRKPQVSYFIMVPSLKSAQVYDLSMSVYHSHRSISEARGGLDMTPDGLLILKLIGILEFYANSSNFDSNLCPWWFVKVVSRL